MNKPLRKIPDFQNNSNAQREGEPECTKCQKEMKKQCLKHSIPQLLSTYLVLHFNIMRCSHRQRWQHCGWCGRVSSDLLGARVGEHVILYTRSVFSNWCSFSKFFFKTASQYLVIVTEYTREFDGINFPGVLARLGHKWSGITLQSLPEFQWM